MAIYLKLYRTKDQAIGDGSVISPLTSFCLENDQHLSHAELKDGTQLQIKEYTPLPEAKDLYVVERPVEPPHNIYYVLEGTTTTTTGNYLPNPLPVPSVGEHKTFQGWFLNSIYSEPATPGMIIHADTYLYGKVVSETLSFYLKNASDASRLGIDELDSDSGITINGSHYTVEELTNGHYDGETKEFSFDYPGDMITYSIGMKEGSAFHSKEGMKQTYSALNGTGIPMIPTGTTLGNITAIVNWEVGETESNIFDLYSIAYLGEAPDKDDEIRDVPENELIELSYSTTGTTYPYPSSGNKDFDILYTTFNGDWSRGEYTTINIPDGTTIEDLLRKYTFVFIVNDYNGTQPGTSGTESSFGADAKNMTMYVQVGSYAGTINLSLPAGQRTETGDQAANWIAFKTRLLGPTESIGKMEDAIEVFNNGQYSFLDSRNNCSTNAYILHSGGRGVISK